MPTYAKAPVEFVRGEGCRLWDAEGREYLDFFAGLSVHNAGNCHPAIVAAIREQAERLGGVSNLFYTEPAMRLAARLAESSLGGKVFLANSGTEANECAIKLARKHAHSRRSRVARDRRARKRLPRPDARRARRHAEARARGSLRTPAGGVRRGGSRRRDCASRRGERAHGRRPRRADPGRGRCLAHRHRRSWGLRGRPATRPGRS